MAQVLYAILTVGRTECIFRSPTRSTRAWRRRVLFCWLPRGGAIAIFRPDEWSFMVQFLSRYLLQRCDESSRALVDAQPSLYSPLENASNPGGLSAQPRWVTSCKHMPPPLGTCSPSVVAANAPNPRWGLIHRKPSAGTEGLFSLLRFRYACSTSCCTATVELSRIPKNCLR
jgi:hypothetical protein